MHSLISKACIALTWDNAQSCRGVKLVRRGDHFAVVSQWQSESGGENEPSVALVDGARALGADANTPMIVGSDACDFGFADLTMPSLDRDNLRNALRFELNKHAPVSQDKLAWGFRVLGAADDDHIRVRLAYIPETQWRRWLDIVSGLSHHVDLIMPAPAALDPLLSGTALYVATDERNGYLFTPEDDGREVLISDGSDDGAFGAGDDPLNVEHLDLGQLAALTADEQRRYAGAVALAMYGTTASLRHDKKTWFPVPDELRPRRHRASRRAAVALAVYIALILLFGFGRSYVEGARYLNDLEAQQAEVRREIEALIEAEDPEQFVSALRDELTGLDLTRPTMLECMITLTKRIPEEYWASNMSWTDGKIELQIRSEMDDLAFLEILKDSALLTDIVPTRKSVEHNGSMTLQVQMRAAVGSPLIRTPSRPTPPEEEAQE